MAGLKSKGGIDEYDDEGNNINTKYGVKDVSSHVHVYDPHSKAKPTQKHIKEALGFQGVSEKYNEVMKRLYDPNKYKATKSILNETSGDDLSDFFPDATKKIAPGNTQAAITAIKSTSTAAVTAIKKTQEAAVQSVTDHAQQVASVTAKTVDTQLQAVSLVTENTAELNKKLETQLTHITNTHKRLETVIKKDKKDVISTEQFHVLADELNKIKGESEYASKEKQFKEDTDAHSHGMDANKKKKRNNNSDGDSKKNDNGGDGFWKNVEEFFVADVAEKIAVKFIPAVSPLLLYAAGAAAIGGAAYVGNDKFKDLEVQINEWKRQLLHQPFNPNDPANNRNNQPSLWENITKGFNYDMEGLSKVGNKIKGVANPIYNKWVSATKNTPSTMQQAKHEPLSQTLDRSIPLPSKIPFKGDKGEHHPGTAWKLDEIIHELDNRYTSIGGFSKSDIIKVIQDNGQMRSFQLVVASGKRLNIQPAGNGNYYLDISEFNMSQSDIDKGIPYIPALTPQQTIDKNIAGSSNAWAGTLNIGNSPDFTKYVTGNRENKELYRSLQTHTGQQTPTTVTPGTPATATPATPATPVIPATPTDMGSILGNAGGNIGGALGAIAGAAMAPKILGFSTAGAGRQVGGQEGQKQGSQLGTAIGSQLGFVGTGVDYAKSIFGGGGVQKQKTKSGQSTQTPGTSTDGGGGGIDRSKFVKELQDNSALREKIMRIAANEQGRNPQGVQAVIESMMNRATVRGTTLEQQAHWHQSEHGYYAEGNMGRGALENPKSKVILEKALDNVLGGSNISNYATDNASQQLAIDDTTSGKFVPTFKSGGETFFSPGTLRGPAEMGPWKKLRDDTISRNEQLEKQSKESLVPSISKPIITVKPSPVYEPSSPFGTLDTSHKFNIDKPGIGLTPSTPPVSPTGGATLNTQEIMNSINAAVKQLEGAAAKINVPNPAAGNPTPKPNENTNGMQANEPYSHHRQKIFNHGHGTILDGIPGRDSTVQFA